MKLISFRFAFVDFKSTSDAKAARVLTNNKKIDGNNIRVSFATPKEQHNEYRNRTSGMYNVGMYNVGMYIVDMYNVGMYIVGMYNVGMYIVGMYIVGMY